MRVKADELQKACQNLLVKYGQEAERHLTDISKEVSRKAVSDLKSTSPGSGRYARNWTHKNLLRKVNCFFLAGFLFSLHHK